jgi:UDP-N-acetylmuramoyl-tripeptide--D-alanyl-D-alanine ligase
VLGLSAREVAAAVGGRLRCGGDEPFEGAVDHKLDAVAIDGRQVTAGTLFVALPGARTDGHAHLGQAREGGASAALVRDADRLPTGMPAVVVSDPLAALQELARQHLARLRPTVVGITGSVGKTTAKDFLFQLLGGPCAGVHAAPASYNSEIGLPLSILGAPPGTTRLVLEYGINAPGEMAALCAVARPDHAWLTAFRAVHLEGMGGLAEVVREKCVLARVAGKQVWMDSATANLAETHGATHAAPLRLVGLEAEGGEVLTARPGAFRVRHPLWGERTLPVVAPHEARTACAAASLAMHLGESAESVGARLETLGRPQGRLTVRALPAGVTVIDDAYNASPASLHVALQVLRDWPAATRRIAVLGTMHELGGEARRLHTQAGSWLAECGAARLHAIGSGGAWLADGADAAGVEAVRHDDVAAAAVAVAADLRPGDVLLLKASRAAALERVLPAVEEAAERLDMQPAGPR